LVQAEGHLSAGLRGLPLTQLPNTHKRFQACLPVLAGPLTGCRQGRIQEGCRNFTGGLRESSKGVLRTSLWDRNKYNKEAMG